MIRKDREIVDIHRIEEIIGEARYMHLGIFDDKYPYVVPLHYGYLMVGDRLTFYVHCAKKGHKLECINKNNNVFVEIDRGERLITAEVPCDYGAEYECVMCRGKATVVSDIKEKREALGLLMRVQTGGEHEISEKMAEAVNVIRIDIDDFTAKVCTR